MPGTTRYSATFDRPYEEDERTGTEPAAANGSRRSRSQSWQANLNERPYTPLGNNRPSQRSASTDSGASKGVEGIPTRTVSKTVVKTHNNPFQFVKVGTSPLYRKAEEQLKKAKEVKKPEVLKEEEEEWQSNLDSWKSRRRKMSEDVFKRQEEIRQFEMEEQNVQTNQKKTKTFSEMVESRAHRGRALSLCLISSPLDLQKWELENSSTSNSSHPFSGSEENSAFNSEDEGVSDKRSTEANGSSNCSNGNGTHSEKNGSSSTCKNKSNRFLEMSDSCSPLKDGIYIDSGLESISSSHRAGDTPDSCSDFSQDSGSSIDCDSPRVSGLILNGVNVLEDFNSKSVHTSDSADPFMKTKGTNSSTHKKESIELLGTVSDGESIAIANGTCDNTNVDCHSKVDTSSSSLSSINRECNTPQKSVSDETNSNGIHKQERSVESENEVFVDDFEELNASAKIFSQNNEESAVKDEKIKAKVSVETSTEKSQSSLIQNACSGTGSLEEESLNIVFQSQPINNKDSELNSSSEVKRSFSGSKENILNDVLPVEKVAEEMEKLILQQLEEEERAKEFSSKILSTSIGSPEHSLIAPPRVSEPPKEKPPPPPSADTEAQKPTALKRINSTKRIKKEIHKRRSNFLGIENRDENLGCDDSVVPPPLALEQILKAEMELDRESMKRLEDAASERIKMEENDIIEKEREIIEILETEERQKNLMNNEELCDIMLEEDRIQKLKEERKRKENERVITEAQRLRLEEEKQLKEREEYIRKQEEAIRKERERLRQEQEALQREREEHRQKLLSEQDEIVKSQQKSHAPTTPVSRIGPVPPLKPTHSPQLTNPVSASPCSRDKVSFPSQSFHGAQNGISDSSFVEQVPVVSKQSKPMPLPKKLVQKEPWMQQKVPSVKKQSHDPMTESKYNQNHWLIQEAEMRRITELKERQHFPISQTHLAGDDVCSNSPIAPAILSPNVLSSPPVQEKVWSYGHAKVAMKKYPPPVSSDKPLIGMYPASQAPSKPSRVVPVERQEQMLSVSGRKRCSHCSEELGRGAAMIIESLQLYYHIHCFQCCVCQAQLGNGSCGTDVRVRNNKLHCHNCYSNDEAGLKFSQV